MKKKSTYGSTIPFLNINLFRKMKLILLFVAISFFQLSAVESYAQNTKIDLSLSDVTLEEAIKTIESKTQFVFFFNNSAVDMTKYVNLNVKNGNIRDVLNQILSSYKYRIEDNKIVLLGEVQQDGKITGVISDAFGPIAGANVVVKGSTNGTITDMDGKFSIDAPKGAILQISYIGYITKELTVSEKKNYNIQLVEDSQALDEVVVVGYGTEKKVNVIGSIAQIGSEKLKNRSTPQLSNALAGQMAGVTVIQRSGRPGDSGGEIRVRGVGTFTSSGDANEATKSDALVLIDGIPGKLNDVSSEDVESISVLKDASTAAIYGSRAANGVILVTTKTGKEGKISVGYNGYIGFNTPTTMPEFVDTWQYATLYNEAVGREAYTQDEIQKFRDGSDPDHYANARYLDEVISRKGLQTGHDLTINGGNAENKYMVSFGYLKQNGVVEKNDYQRYNARVNLINEIMPGLKLTSRLSGVYGNRKEPMVPGGDDVDMMPYIIQKALRFPGLTPTIMSDGTFGLGHELHGTPAGWIQTDSFYERPEFSLNANVRLDYNPIKDLQLSAIGAYTYTNIEERKYRSTMKLAGDRLLGPSELRHKMDKTIYKTFQATAEYNKTINGHSFGILAGYSWEQEDYRYIQGSRDKFPGNDLPYINAGSPDNQKSEGSGNAWAIQSGFGRLRYNFNERYLFESTVRYDGSSRFPKSKKFGFFPSVAVGWRLSEENFFKENESLGFISNLKLKASWGLLGNQNIGNYPYQSVYELGQNYPFGDIYSQGAAVTTAVDPTIKWEETETIDGGLEAVLWNGLLSVNASYFYRNTYDILYKPSGSISAVLGQKISEMNTGKLKNSGWEFEVGHRNTIGNVSYNVNANLSIINNKLKTLGVGNVEQLNGMVGNGTDLFVGYPIQMYYGYVSDGVFLDEKDIEGWHDQSKVTPKPRPGDIRYKDISGPDGVPDGKIDPNYDRVYLGSRIPKFTFGLNLGVEYKGFDLAVLLQGVAGVKGLLSGSAGYAFSGEGNIQKWQAEGRFDPKNPIRYPDYPRLEAISGSSPNTVTSDFWLLDASYIRLKNVQLGYTFPKKILQAAKISNLRVYVQAENPLCWNKYKPGWDPEINTSGNYYPILATYTFGVNFKF